MSHLYDTEINAKYDVFEAQLEPIQVQLFTFDLDSPELELIVIEMLQIIKEFRAFLQWARAATLRLQTIMSCISPSFDDFELLVKLDVARKGLKEGLGGNEGYGNRVDDMRKLLGKIASVGRSDTRTYNLEPLTQSNEQPTLGLVQLLRKVWVLYMPRDRLVI